MATRRPSDVDGRRFVITAVSRLSVRVARALTEAGADVVLGAGRNADDDLTSVVARVATIRTEDVDRATSLRAAGLEGAERAPRPRRRRPRQPPHRRLRRRGGTRRAGRAPLL